jgi:hypothetical protein
LPYHSQLVNNITAIVFLLACITINYIILKKIHFKHKINKVLLAIPIAIFVVLAVGVLLIVIALVKNNYDRRPALVNAVYTKTSDRDVNIILSKTPNANLIKKETLYKDNKNVVENLYCFTIPKSNTSKLITNLANGLLSVPLTNQGFKYTSNNLAISKAGNDKYASIGLSSNDVNYLQSQFNLTKQTEMSFSISGSNSNNSDLYNGAIALKTNNPSIYPSANIDIEVNNSDVPHDCKVLNNQNDTSNKLNLSVDTTLSNNDFLFGIFNSIDF